MLQAHSFKTFMGGGAGCQKQMTSDKVFSSSEFVSASSGPYWQPAANVYKFEDRMEVWLEVAGVPEDQLSVRVETGWLIVEGKRPCPGPKCAAGEHSQALDMEISHGAFQRRISLSRAIAIAGLQASYRDGLLCVILPFENAQS